MKYIAHIYTDVALEHYFVRELTASSYEEAESSVKAIIDIYRVFEHTEDQDVLINNLKPNLFRFSKRFPWIKYDFYDPEVPLPIIKYSIKAGDTSGLINVPKGQYLYDLIQKQ